MNGFLNSPILDKKIGRGFSKNRKIEFFTMEMQGWRSSMEDEIIAETNISGDWSLFAVFEGHVNSKVSNFLKNNFLRILTSNKNFKVGNFVPALEESFIDTEHEIQKLEPKIYSGSTAIVTCEIHSGSTKQQTPQHGTKSCENSKNMDGEK